MAFAFALIFVVFILIVGWLGARRSGAAATRPSPRVVRTPQPPADLFLDPKHAWVRLCADGTLKIGIDELLVELIGCVDRVELPAAEGRVERGEPLLVLHQGQRRLSVPSPVAGVVFGINSALVDEPRTLTDDPYGLGWAVTLRPRDHKEALAPLHVGNGAVGLLRAELGRVVDFLVQTVAPGESPLLADGGLPRRGALAELDDEGWQAFQQRFLS